MKVRMHRAASALAAIAVTLLFASAAAAAAEQAMLLIVNKSDATVSFIEAADGERVATVEVGAGPHEIAASPDGRLAVATNYGTRGEPGSTLSVIDVTKREVVRTIDLAPYHRPHGIQFFPDGRRAVVTCEQEKKLVVVNVETGEVERAIDTDQEISHMVALGPKARRAFVANIGSGSVSVIDLARGELVKVIETGAGAEGVALRPGSSEVWVTNRSADTVSVIDTRSLEVIQTAACESFPIRIAFTPDGETALVSCARSGDVAIFDAVERQIAHRVAMNAQPVDENEKQQRLFRDVFGQSPVPIGLLIRPDGRRAYVANTNADVITEIDLTASRVVRRLRAGREPDGLAWSVVE